MTHDLARIDAASSAFIGPAATAAPVKGGNGLSWLGLGLTESANLWQSVPGADRDLYSVARCIGSESPGPSAALLTIGECIWAEARALGVTPWTLLTGRSSSAYEFTRGRYGEQAGRFASTARQPTGRHLEAARQAKAGSDLARGARRWLSLRVLDGGSQAGRHVDAADVVIARWANLGWQWVGPIAGVDTYRHSLYALVKSRPVDTRGIMAAIEAGRAGKSTAVSDSHLETDLVGAGVALGAAVAAIKLL